jgi:hypothetical protein
LARFPLPIDGDINKQRFSGFVTLTNRFRSDFFTQTSMLMEIEVLPRFTQRA